MDIDTLCTFVKDVYEEEYEGNRRRIVFPCLNNSFCVDPEHLSISKKYANEEGQRKAFVKRIERNSIRDKSTGCLLWQKGLNEDGYARGWVNGRCRYIHRALWELTNYRTLSKNIRVRHKCKNRHCVAIDHLETGTDEQNSYDDRLRDGTLIRGSNHPNSKISEDIAQAIKDSKGEGIQKERAQKFGCSRMTVVNIDAGRSWGWLLFRGESDPRYETHRTKARNRKRLRGPPSKEDYERTMKRIKSRMIEEQKVDGMSACFILNQGLTTTGYARISIASKVRRAHRIVSEYYYNNATELKEDQFANHHCDVRNCVRKEHLYVGTAAQNAKDKRKRGRERGINSELASDIWKLKGVNTAKEVSNLLNVSEHIVYHIWSKKSHKYLHADSE